MVTRADILERFELFVHDAYEIEPHHHESGIWMIKFSHEGDPAKILFQDNAERLADEIRAVDRHLAEQIDACLEKARRSSKDPI